MDKINALLDNQTLRDGAFLFAILLLLGGFKFSVEGILQ